MIPGDAISIQLYSARAIEPLEAQFELLAGIGFTAVEPWGGLLAHAGKLKGLLAKHAMRAPTAHIGLPSLRENAKAVAATCRDLGVDIVIAPAPPPGEREKDRDGWIALGRELNAIGKIITGEGLRFAWHNHHWEFIKTAAGDIPFELMFAQAPDMLWQADLAWMARAGADPLVWLKRFAGRVPACHVKDMAPAGQCLDEDGWADAGHGTFDWQALLAGMRGAGTKLFVLEHDKPNDVARFARRSRATVASWT